jgi:uncharacterized protein YbgA (DUF1722 family)/uncharacterized protein YbbK (DUF523 family)
MEEIRLGISACLLGEPVRYNGGHKLDRYLLHTLGRYVSFVPVCPEAECGLGIPREAMRLKGDPSDPSTHRLRGSNTDTDYTPRMQAWIPGRLEQLAAEDLCGFVFKSGSPSSGMERVKVYNDKGMPEKKGAGLFARAFMERFPDLPVEDDGRLHDPGLRENFIERVFTLRRWRAAESLAREGSLRHLQEFHASHKLLLMAHSPEHYRSLGRLAATAKDRPRDEVLREYREGLMEGLGRKATPKKHANVLTHVQGYFKKRLSADEKQEFMEVVEQHRQGLVPLIVPVTLARHYVRKYQEPYLLGQWYLEPHPVELQLRNHV